MLYKKHSQGYYTCVGTKFNCPNYIAIEPQISIITMINPMGLMRQLLDSEADVCSLIPTIERLFPIDTILI